MKFRQNVMDATAAWDLVVTDEAQLAGLPESAREAAAESARSKGAQGWRFTLQEPSVMPALRYLDDAALRRAVWTAYSQRAHGGDLDNGDLVLEILRLRRKKAR